MQKILKPLIITVILCLALIYFYVQQKSPQELEIYFLDVGQGDAVLIRTSDNQDILLDGGPDQKVLSELDKILPIWDKDIELMILTHVHADHFMGLISVLNQYQVKEIIFNPVDDSESAYQEWLRLIAEKNIPVSQAFAGDEIILGADLVLNTLYPFKDANLNNLSSQNNASIVNLLTYQNNHMLFTGDISADDELQIMSQLQNIDLLKVAHHGSKYSTSAEFLKKANPSWAIISCGLDNNFGHPHFAALWRLKNSGAEILRTEQTGTIKCVSNGQEMACNSFDKK